jgi:hypothetical protein
MTRKISLDEKSFIKKMIRKGAVEKILNNDARQDFNKSMKDKKEELGYKQMMSNISAEEIYVNSDYQL